MKKWKRWIARVIFLILFVVISVDLCLAGVFVFAVTHPGCGKPTLLPGVGNPEEIWLRSVDGKNIRAWYYPSRNGAAVLALGGLGGTSGNQLPPVGFIIEHGYGVLQIDSRNCARPPSLVTLGIFELYDAIAGLEYLQAQTGIIRDKIAVFGFSMGGATAIRLAARSTGISAVIDEGGYFNLGRDIVEPDEPANGIRQLFLYTIAGLLWLKLGASPWESSPLDDIGKIAPCPVFLIYGENERMRSRADQQFQAASQPKQMWIVPGGAHGTNYWVSKEEYEKRILTFLDHYLFINPVHLQPEG